MSSYPNFAISPEDKVAFVNGFFDHSVSNIVSSEAAAYRGNHPPGASAYFAWTDSDELASYINSNSGHVIIISHSYGADIAAKVVANSPIKVDALLTLDPVSLNTPSYASVMANTKIWLNYNAVGGGVLDGSNIVAGAGSD